MTKKVVIDPSVRKDALTHRTDLGQKTGDRWVTIKSAKDVDSAIAEVKQRTLNSNRKGDLIAFPKLGCYMSPNQAIEYLRSLESG